jgi:SAM-dependent methyltransferase
MDPTGERYIPHLDTAHEIACEHWHRYLYASQFVADKVVLDIASGEGYGSHYLAGVAKQVIGVEADAQAVRHASSKYVRPNLEFRCGSAEVIPVEGKQVFDAVVCFETIEHLWEGQQLTFLREIDRLLKPDGVFLVSTPNKFFYYHIRPGGKNPFHRREFYYDDYLSLLRRHFRTVHLLGQKMYPVSYIWQPAGPPLPLSEYQLRYSDGQFGPVTGDKKELLYMLAVCSNGELGLPSGSLLVDVTEAPTPVPPEVPAEGPPQLATGKNGDSQQALADLRRALEEHIREEAMRQENAQIQQRFQELTRENEASQHQIAKLQHALAKQQGRANMLNEASQRRIAKLQRALAEQQARADTLNEASQRQIAELQRALAEQQARADTLTETSQSQIAELQRALAEQQERTDTLTEASQRQIDELQRALVEQQGRADTLTETSQHQIAELQRALAEQQERADALTEASQRQISELQRALAEQQERADALAAQIELRADREKALREMLLDAHDQLLRRDEEIQVALAKALQQQTPVITGAIAANQDSIPGKHLPYQLLLHRIREVVRSTLPLEARVLVISKGDDQLLKLTVQPGWHFPQNEQGVWAGYYPADSAEAIQHLEELRAKGADHLLIPATSLWWLDHYAEFREHLENHYREVVRQNDVCVIFALYDPAQTEQRQYQQLIQRIREAVQNTLPAQARVLVVSKGDEELLKLGDHQAEHFPQVKGGVYAGHHPADSAEAIAHLEDLRRGGADFLLLPSTALWWLEHYTELRRHLEAHYPAVLRQEDTCFIFALRDNRESKEKRTRRKKFA